MRTESGNDDKKYGDLVAVFNDAMRSLIMASVLSHCANHCHWTH
jgi:hypothetical protein